MFFYKVHIQGETILVSFNYQLHHTLNVSNDFLLFVLITRQVTTSTVLYKVEGPNPVM